MYVKLNTEVLWNYFSFKLKTFLRILDKDGTVLEEISSLPNFQDDITPLLDLQAIVSREKISDVPLLFSVNHYFVYGVVSIRDKFLLVGPMNVSGSLQYHLNFEIQLTSNFTVLRVIPFNEFLLDILTIHNSFGKDITELDIARVNLRHSPSHESARATYTNQTFQKQEGNLFDHSYYFEKREQTCIENGDMEQFLKTVSENITFERFLLEKKTHQQIRNLCITMIAVSCRSAIRGGLNPEVAYTLEDSYIRQLEKIDQKMHLLNFVREVQTHYIALIRELKGRRQITEEEADFRIEKCKAYIHSHLHDKLNVAGLAKELHYNPDYLSHIFKQIEGVGLADYIMNAKIQYVRDLLIYTNDSYSKIASDLGFSSQSHLGKQFKLSTGSTLHKFRQSHRM